MLAFIQIEITQEKTPWGMNRRWILPIVDERKWILPMVEESVGPVCQMVKAWF